MFAARKICFCSACQMFDSYRKINMKLCLQLKFLEGFSASFTMVDDQYCSFCLFNFNLFLEPRFVDSFLVV